MLDGIPRRAHVLCSTVVLSASCGLSCGGSPTAPERHGFPLIIITCEPATGSSTVCRAGVSCSMYACPPGTPTDVTTVATWTTDDASVVRIAGPGLLESVALGDTVVRASWQGASAMFRSVSVFAGTPPLPTFEIDGYILEAAATVRTPIDGARVEILNGVVAGRTVLSGQPPAPRPGSTVFSAPGLYRLTGVPNGSFRVRVTKDGYVPQERDVAGSQFTGANFLLERR